MKNKVALEEHFATTDTIEDSREYFPGTAWPAAKGALLDVAETRLALMDECGIGFVILSLNAPVIQSRIRTADAVDLAQRSNDALAEYVSAHPDRFGGFAAIPLQDPDAAAAELTRCVKDLGMVGALVNGFSQVDDEDTIKYYDLPEYRSFWSVVAELNVPFYLHPRNPLVSQSRLIDGHPWLMGPAWQFAVETAGHALRLMGSGLFDDYPSLQIILGHLGEMLPAHIWRTSHWASADGRNPQGIPAEKSFLDYFRQNFYLTTSGDFRTMAMRNAIDEIGVERVLFSTDYPFEDMKEAAAWFDRCEIGENDREAIGYQNAKRLFNIP